MFGLATKKDWNSWIAKANKEINDEMVSRYNQIRIELMNQLEESVKAQAPKPQPPEPVKLYTVEVTKDGERIGTYCDVTHVYDERGGYSEQLNIYRTSGQVVLKGKDYSYSLTEQKAEPEEEEKLDLIVFNIGEAVRKLEDSHKVVLMEWGELNHRIELLELRLNGAGKQAKPKTRK